MTTGVTIDFNANLARFTGAIDKATNDLNKFQSNAQRISGNIKSAFGALGVGLGVSAFVGLVKSSIDAQDRLLDLSKTTRLSVEDLSGLASAAKKSGSDLDGTAKAINKLAVEMGKDSEKFAALGINAKSPLEAFGQLADVLNAIEDPQKRAAAASIALGKSWQDSAPLLEEGGKGIRELIARGKELSKITTESAKRADEFNDRWEDMKSIAAGWGTAIADPIVKGLLKIGNALNMEIDRAPGSIAEFLLGPKAGYTGPLDQYGLPAKPGAPKVASPTPPKPSARAVDKFINGEAAGKTSKAANDLKRLIELGQRNQFELLDSEEEQRILATTRAMRDATEEFQALQRIIKVGEENELAAYYETAGEETMRLVAEQRALQAEVKESNGFARDLGLTFTSAFEEAFVGGEKLSDVIKGLGRDIAAIIGRKKITEPFGNALSGLLDKIDFGGIFKAGGGAVSGGQSYIVGERGPELFTPGTSGVITPNHALKAGGTTNHFTVDMRGASVEAVARLEQLVMSVNGSIERRALNVMGQARLRGAT